MERNDKDLRYDERQLNKLLERCRKRQQTQLATEIPDCRKGKCEDNVKKNQKISSSAKEAFDKKQTEIATQMRKLRLPKGRKLIWTNSKQQIPGLMRL
eukprot:4671940-Ditylum_brightwellii.AAC.1